MKNKMSFFKATTFVTLFFTSGSLFANDFDHCAQFLQPAINNSMGMMGSAQPFPSLPFAIDDNGRFSPKPGVNYQMSEDGREELYATKELVMIGPGMNGMQERPVNFYVKRDEDGNVVSIKRAIQYLPDDIQQAKDQQSEMISQSINQAYEFRVQQQQRELTEQEKQNRDTAISEQLENSRTSMFSGNSVEFGYKNGKCFPKKSSFHMKDHSKDSVTEKSSTMMDTALCKELNDFFVANPEASACFKKDLNARIQQVFSKFADAYQEEMNPMENNFGLGMGYGGYGYPGLASGYGFGGGFGGTPINFGSVARKLSFNLPTYSEEYFNSLPEEYREEARARLQEQSRKANLMMGSSPIIRGQQMVQGCLQQGLEPVINDEELWKGKEQALQATPNPHATAQ